MDSMKNLIDKYNEQDTLLVISLYPKKGELYSAGTSGVASYTKNVISNLNRKVIVLADTRDGEKIYEEGNVLVIRCFKPNSPLMWAQLIKNIVQFNQIKKVLIQFDFAIYGGMVASGAVIPFLLTLRLLGYQPSIVSHHVVVDVKKLSGHVGLGKSFRDKLKGELYNFIFRQFYKALGILTSQIIVLEETLIIRLHSLMPHANVISIPHGVDQNLTPISKAGAREILGIGQDEHVVMFFGFVNWFKGADLFVDFFRSSSQILGKKIRCILAGGESPTLKNRAYYQAFLKLVLKKVKRSKSVEITGYIPQEKIGLYFSAADLVVFPYRYFMTASGVLSLVFSYRKPFIVSEELSEMFQAEDFKQVMEASNLQKEDFVFDLSKKSCFKLTRKVLKNGIQQKMIRMSELMGEKRAYQKNAKIYDQAIFGVPSLITQKTLSPSYN